MDTAGAARVTRPLGVLVLLLGPALGFNGAPLSFLPRGSTVEGGAKSVRFLRRPPLGLSAAESSSPSSSSSSSSPAAAVSAQTSSSSSSSTSAAAKGPSSKWPAYVQMCRPGNLPASLLFVLGGAMATTHDPAAALRWPVLLAAANTCLVTTSSCVVNDYFDFRVGTDADDDGNLVASGALALEDVKGFVSKLYSVLLYGICLAPTAPIRLLLMAGSVSTFVYTKRLKPYTWLKNLSVAFICAMAPAVGGMAASLDPATFRPPIGEHAVSLVAVVS